MDIKLDNISEKFNTLLATPESFKNPNPVNKQILRDYIVFLNTKNSVYEKDMRIAFNECEQQYDKAHDYAKIIYILEHPYPEDKSFDARILHSNTKQTVTYYEDDFDREEMKERFETMNTNHEVSKKKYNFVYAKYKISWILKEYLSNLDGEQITKLDEHIAIIKTIKSNFEKIETLTYDEYDKNENYIEYIEYIDNIHNYIDNKFFDEHLDSHLYKNDFDYYNFEKPFENAEDNEIFETFNYPIAELTRSKHKPSTVVSGSISASRYAPAETSASHYAHTPPREFPHAESSSIKAREIAMAKEIAMAPEIRSLETEYFKIKVYYDKIKDSDIISNLEKRGKTPEESGDNLIINKKKEEIQKLEIEVSQLESGIEKGEYTEKELTKKKLELDSKRKNILLNQKLIQRYTEKPKNKQTKNDELITKYGLSESDIEKLLKSLTLLETKLSTRDSRLRYIYKVLKDPSVDDNSLSKKLIKDIKDADTNYDEYIKSNNLENIITRITNPRSALGAEEIKRKYLKYKYKYLKLIEKNNNGGGESKKII